MVAIAIQTVNLPLGTKPVGRDCPKCGNFLMEKKVRGGGKQVVCSNGDYEEEKIK